jgi:hypothetical protein
LGLLELVPAVLGEERLDGLLRWRRHGQGRLLLAAEGDGVALADRTAA